MGIRQPAWRGKWGVVGMGEDSGELTGRGQGKLAALDRTGESWWEWDSEAGSPRQDRTGWGQLAAWHRTRGSRQDTSEVGLQQPPAIQQHAGRQPQGQARQAGEHRVLWGTGAGSCHPWPRHRAAVGRGQGAGEQAGRGQGAASPSRLRAAKAQSGCRQGAGGPGQGAGARERV